jgi:hypothetical protein
VVEAKRPSISNVSAFKLLACDVAPRNWKSCKGGIEVMKSSDHLNRSSYEDSIDEMFLGLNLRRSILSNDYSVYNVKLAEFRHGPK